MGCSNSCAIRSRDEVARGGMTTDRGGPHPGGRAANQILAGQQGRERAQGAALFLLDAVAQPNLLS